MLSALSKVGLNIKIRPKDQNTISGMAMRRASLMINLFVLATAFPGQASDFQPRKLEVPLGSYDQGAIGFRCDHSSKRMPRSCELWGVIYLSEKPLREPTYFTLSREYLHNHVTRDNASIAGVASPSTHLSFWLNDSKVAEGDFPHGYGENMRLLSRDFLVEARTAQFAMMEVSERGRVTRYRFNYDSRIAKCFDLGDTPTDEEFDTMTAKYAGRAYCGFWWNLGEVRVTDPEETSELFKKEKNF